MYIEKFVSYVGDYRIHDSKIQKIEIQNNLIQINLISYDHEIIIVKFKDIKQINLYNPIDKILYAISEMEEELPFRKFVFAYDNEDEESSLIM